MTISERERLKALERENHELKRANKILRKASVFFAQEVALFAKSHTSIVALVWGYGQTHLLNGEH